jgi:hypothetical protein
VLVGDRRTTLLALGIDGLQRRFDRPRHAYINSKIEKVESKFDSRFDRIDKRFGDMRDLWRAELRRVEEVLDSRLKHLEESG